MGGKIDGHGGDLNKIYKHGFKAIGGCLRKLNDWPRVTGLAADSHLGGYANFVEWMVCAGRVSLVTLSYPLILNVVLMFHGKVSFIRRIMMMIVRSLEFNSKTITASIQLYEIYIYSAKCSLYCCNANICTNTRSSGILFSC